MRRLAAALRREPLFFLVLGAAAIAAIAPLWVGRYVPLLDYPNHLSMVFVWFHLHDPRWNFAPFYAINLVPLPYWAEYILVYALSFVFRPEIAHKLFVTLSILGLPAAVAVYARRTGRDPRLCILAFPLAWSFGLTQGFIQYAGGLPFLFLALAALDRYAERPGRRWFLIATAAGALLYFFHLVVFLVYLVIGGVTALAAPRPWRARSALLAPLPTLPALAVAALCYRVATSMTQYGSHRAPTGLSAIEGLYLSVGEVLSQLPDWLMNVHPGSSDEAALIALGLIWILLVAARPLSAPAPVSAPARGGGASSDSASDPASDSASDPADLDDRDLRTWRVELAAAVALVLLFVLPRSLIRPFYWYGVSRRVGVIFALLAVLCVRGRMGGPRRTLIAAAGVVGLLFGADVTLHFHRFNVRARDYEAVIAVVPRGQRVLPLILNDSDPDVNVRAYAQWGTWVQIRRGGYMLYALETQTPIRYRRQPPAPPWDRPGDFNCADHLDEWDYFLLHGPSPIDPFAACPDQVRLVGTRGDWSLWKKVTPAP